MTDRYRLAQAAAAYVAFTAALISAPAIAGSNAWTQVGPDGGFVRDIAYHLTSPSIVYLAGGAGFFRSTDGGETWQLVSIDFLNSPSDIAVDPTDPSRIYIAAQGEGVFVSTDAGATLTKLANTPPGIISAYNVEVSHDGSALYATAGLRVYRSLDDGQTWTERTAVSPHPQAGGTFFLRAAPDDENVLYSLTNLGLHKTTDGGDSWQKLDSNPALARATDLAIDPQNSQRLLAATLDSGLAVSIDGGATWTITTQLGSILSTVAFDPVDPAVWIVADQQTGLHRSVDRGAHWTPIGAGLRTGHVNKLAVDPTASNRILVGGIQGLSLTTDAGASWTGRNSGYAASRVTAAAVAGDDRIYLASASRVDYLASGGSSSVATNLDALAAATLNPPIALIQKLLAKDSATGTLLLAAFNDQSLVRSTDGGASWASVPAPFGTAVKSFASSAAGAIFAGATGGVYKSVDDGLLWTQHSGGLPLMSISALATASSDPNVVYAGTALPFALGGSGVYRSNDGGVSWAAANAGFADRAVNALAIHPTDAQTVYACVEQALIKSTDGGGSWNALSWYLPTHPSPITATCYSVALDPSEPRIVYLAVYHHIARSVDAGATWELMKSFDTRQTVDGATFVVDPQRPHRLVAGTNGAGALQFSIEPDLALTQTPATTPLPLSAEATYTYSVKNNGPFHATGVRLVVTLPAGARSATASVPGGQCTNTDAAISCTIDTLRTGDAKTINVRFTPTTAGAARMDASVTGAQPDAVAANNQISSDATASVPPAPQPQPSPSGGGGGGGNASLLELLALLAAWGGLQRRRRSV
jgi:uncharacterized repeat protein (TIGR01451 family)